MSSGRTCPACLLPAATECICDDDTGRDQFPLPADDPPIWERCQVFWGDHACKEKRWHPASTPHACDCCGCDDHPDLESGCVALPPYYGKDTKFFGDDAADYRLPLERRLAPAHRGHRSRRECSLGDKQPAPARCPLHPGDVPQAVLGSADARY